MRRLVLIFFIASVSVLAGAPEVVAEPAEYKQVVDNATEDRVEADEGWGTSSYGQGVKESNYRFARPEQGSADASTDARFRFEIPETANYTVSVRWPEVKGGNDGAWIGVMTTSDIQWTQVNQQKDGGRWVKLGVFQMSAGDDYSVVFSRKTEGKGYVIADAVKVEWESPVAAPPEPPKSEETTPEPQAAPSDRQGAREAVDRRSSGNGAARTSESIRPASRSGQEVVKEARPWTGVKYQLGGQTRRGVDCSGLTMMVFKRFGVSLPHWDDKQYRMGAKVAKGQEQPGDLVFFNEHGRGISHVGIYAGNGKLVHASDYFGEVTEGKMKYIKGYVGARRML
ncbi:MAG: NlpC/P60 family protein [Actinomycetota bacterium]|nr:NlpC/P60 family protein [Actinomycetota bacterium]